MKAITLKDNGGIENLIFTEVPVPKVESNEVLIQVKAVSINPVDAFVRQSQQGLKIFLNPKPDEKVIILGWDLAGTVTEVGPGVTHLKKGDDVFGLVKFTGHGKAYAEYAVAPADQLALKPANISYEEAAAATLAALTAWQALVTHANVKPGEKVVVYAAAGGVGHYAVQMAKSLGAYVVGVTSTGNVDFVKSFGADRVIDYTTETPDQVITDADVVIDAVAGDHILRSMDSLKPGGRLISLLSAIEGEVESKVNAKKLTAIRMVVKSNGDDMNAIASLLHSGKIRSHVSEKFKFSDLPKAHQQIETRKTKGKIVVSLQ